MRPNGWTFLSLALLLLGVGFWLYMMSAGTASDVGVYSVGATLVGFGAAGTVVSLMLPRPA